MDQKPPKYAEKLLLFFLRDDLVEEVTGDLDEKYNVMLKSGSRHKARINYWFQVFNYMRPFALKYFRSDSIFITKMKYNFLIGYRVLLKNKLFSSINIGGLALGMSVAILIGLWIYDEFSFNTNHENYDRIVQVLRQDTRNGNPRVSSSLGGRLGVTLQEEYANYFEQVAMTFYRSGPQVLKTDRFSGEEMGYFFQPSVIELLSLEMLAGPGNGLAEPDGIILSESLANTMFYGKDPLGQVITLNATVDLTVKAVYKDLPKNSTFGDADFFASQNLIYNSQNPYTWDNYNIKILATLREGVKHEEASLAIKNVLNEKLDLEEPIYLQLLPMKDWHLNSYFEQGIQVTSERMKFIWLYAIIGILVLLIACINFMNLNTARYQTRAKEIGIRKTIGSFRYNLIWQFLTESMIYAFAALILALILVLLTLPTFSSLADKDLVFPFSNIWFWLSCFAFALLSALIAGSYPALFLSSFKPVNALKGNIGGAGSGRFRQVLVVFQFTISIVLVIGTIVVYQQIDYAKDRPLGYEQDKLITITGQSEEYYKKFDLLRTELKKTGAIEELAAADYPLINTRGNNGGFSYNEQEINGIFNTVYVSPEYGAATKWELLMGRDFSRELDESASIIISESAAKLIGLSDPIGKVVKSPHDYNEKRHFTIIGVVKDMVKGSPFEPTMPLILFCTENALTYMFLRLSPDQEYNAALAELKKVYEYHLPQEGFNYSFVDEEYLSKFRPEEQVSSFATFFCILAVLLSCLGLFGLSAFILTKRIKEIGVRKVMGASLINLWSLLTKDFGLLVMIAFVIAVPVAYHILRIWLDGYAYRVDLKWWVFVLGGLTCVLITLLTVSYHSLKVSSVNPVKSLRSE